MKRTFCFALGLAATVALAQDTFPGTSIPMTMSPSALTASFFPIRLKEQGSSIFGDFYSSSSYSLQLLGVRGDDKRIQQLLEMISVSWTRNEIADLYGQRFIVTYIFQPSQEVIRWFAEGQPLPDPTLKLKLVKADQIGSIEPFPELNKEKFIELLNDFGQKSKPAFNASKATVALSNAKQLATAMMIYLADYDDIFPYVQSSPSLLKQLEPYTKNPELFKTLNPKGAGMFRFNMSLAGVSSVDIDEPAKTPMLFDPEPFPDGRYLVAYADSHARYLTAEEWKATQKYMKVNLPRHGKPIKGG
ncbi:MAG: hypothetical protein ABL962_10200 [Fimbriimonadaceae bacterium]